MKEQNKQSDELIKLFKGKIQFSFNKIKTIK